MTGEHGKVKTTTSDRIYYVLEENGEFIIGDKTFPVQKTDVIIVPKDTAYNYRATWGTFRLFLVHAPAYDPKGEMRLK